jgi:hypothetical protein
VYVNEQDGPGGSAGSSSAGDLTGFPNLGLTPGTVVHGGFTYNVHPPEPLAAPGLYAAQSLSLDLPGISFSIPNPVVAVFPGFSANNGDDFAIRPSAPMNVPSVPDISVSVALGLRTNDPGFGPQPPILFDLGKYFDAFVRVTLTRGEDNYAETYIRIVEIQTLHTPIPAALPLFGTGFVALGFAVYRLRRRNPV